MNSKKWISIKDKLPPERKLVLCYQPSNYKYSKFLVLARIGDKFHPINNNAEIDIWGNFSGITHWQKLLNP